MKPLSVARDLQRRRARERTGLFIAEGVRCIEELLSSQLRVRSVIISPTLRETERGASLDAAVRTAARDRRFELSEATELELATAADTDAPQGIVAIAERPERSFGNVGEHEIMLILDGIQDPGNLGTILRTAEAFGVVATVALPGTVDIWNPKVVRSAMGALFSHNAFHASVADTLNFLQTQTIPIWATSADGEPVSRASAGSGLAIVVGNEAGGVSADLIVAAARTVAIPIRGVESLNVAVATGILLYAITTA